MKKKKESWNSQLGIILAVAGSAVGLGNFLRFPGNVAQNGGAAFMIAYFICFLLLGLPMCWAEWGIGRLGGTKNFNSSPGILGRLVPRFGKYLGIFGIIIPLFISMYYLYIESWCLGYAVNFAAGNMNFSTAEQSANFANTFTGVTQNGGAIGISFGLAGAFVLVCIVINFILIYRGVSKGIEKFCNFAMPTLLVLAILVLIRVLTLGTPDPTKPENSISNGLGFLWNPEKVFVEEKQVSKDGSITWLKKEEIVGESFVLAKQAEIAGNLNLRIKEYSIWELLMSGRLWLAAAGQLFFSLSIAAGVITTYSSYLKRNDDVALSGLASCTTNEFFEVVFGGLITVPAAVAFVGIAGISGVLSSTFGLGFNALPLVFAHMPFGQFFGTLFFFLLFLAAVTSSISMIQPSIAFLEEAFDIGRKRSVAILLFVVSSGALFVSYFSADMKGLDTMDFWAGTVLIYISATILIILFSWVIGVDKGLAEIHRGANIRIPKVYRFIMKYITPSILITVFACFLLFDVFGVGGGTIDYRITDLTGSAAKYAEIDGILVEVEKAKAPNPVAWGAVGLMITTAVSVAIIVTVRKKYNFKHKLARKKRIQTSLKR